MKDKRKTAYWEVPRGLWRLVKKWLPSSKRTGKAGRPRAENRGVLNGIWYVLWTGCQWKAIHKKWFGVCSTTIHARFQEWQRAGVFRRMMRALVRYYHRQRRIGWKWQSLDSKSVPAPLALEAVGKSPVDRGKHGSKIHLLVDQRGAPLAVYVTGANRHDKQVAPQVMVAIVVPRPSSRQHLCADTAYDANDLRQLLLQDYYEVHIPHNPRRGQLRLVDPTPFPSSHSPRRWVVERTLSSLAKRRSIRTRWTKRADNWLALLQLASAHILFDLAIYG
jgi:putative transposase